MKKIFAIIEGSGAIYSELQANIKITLVLILLFENSLN